MRQVLSLPGSSGDSAKLPAEDPLMVKRTSIKPRPGRFPSHHGVLQVCQPSVELGRRISALGGDNQPGGQAGQTLQTVPTGNGGQLGEGGR
jgi:hypothetical protein